MNEQRECALKNQFEELKTDSYRKLRIYIGKKNCHMPCKHSRETKVPNTARRISDEKAKRDGENTQLNLGHRLPAHINSQRNTPTNPGVGWESVLCFNLAGLKEIMTEVRYYYYYYYYYQKRSEHGL